MLNRVIVDNLMAMFPGKVFLTKEELSKHSRNLFYISDKTPDAVFYAENEDDIISVTDFCIQNKIPLIPYGSGTSVEGHFSAVNGGICLNLSKMKKIKEFSAEDGYVTVEPGISYNELNDYLQPYGFHFPVEAGWGASIGGMVATNASGAGATDSGSMKNNVMACSFIGYKDDRALKIKAGSKSQKTSAGYNIMSLLVGSEGTLGIITEITLKIRKNFLHYSTIVCQFETIQQAVNFVSQTKGLIPYRRVEFLDKLQTKACKIFSSIDFLCENKNTILIELFGNEFSVCEEVRLVEKYLRMNSAANIKVFSDRESSTDIWKMRKNACPAAISLIDSSKKAMATDTSVPLSKLSVCIEACYKHMRELGLTAPLVAHIGDGNFHFTIILNPNNSLELERAKRFNKLVVDEALKVGGTCTGEHGVGLGKIDYLELEHGDSIFLMIGIKKTFDPINIFNPGKIFNLNRAFKCEDISTVDLRGDYQNDLPSIVLIK